MLVKVKTFLGVNLGEYKVNIRQISSEYQVNISEYHANIT